MKQGNQHPNIIGHVLEYKHLKPDVNVMEIVEKSIKGNISRNKICECMVPRLIQAQITNTGLELFVTSIVLRYLNRTTHYVEHGQIVLEWSGYHKWGNTVNRSVENVGRKVYCSDLGISRKGK